MTTTAVVTGASSGMGLFASVELAKRGLDVVATVRDTVRDTLRAGALLGAAEQVGVSVQVAELEVTARTPPTDWPPSRPTTTASTC